MVLKLPNKIVKILQKRRIKISLAESCTGGMLSSQITSVKGASKIFGLGIVSYSNQSKIKTSDNNQPKNKTSHHMKYLQSIN